MELHDLLHTFAELGVGLAGFTGVVVALQSRGGSSAERDPTNYFGLITSSCTVVIFAAMPLVLLQWFQDLLAWRLSSGLLLLWLGVWLFQVWRPTSQLRSTMSWVAWMALPGFVVCMLGLAGVVAGLWPTAIRQVYATVVFYVLLLGLRSFVNLLRPPAAQS